MKDFKNTSLRAFLVAAVITLVLILLHDMRAYSGGSGMGLLEPAAGSYVPKPEYSNRIYYDYDFIISLYY